MTTEVIMIPKYKHVVFEAFIAENTNSQLMNLVTVSEQRPLFEY